MKSPLHHCIGPDIAYWKLGGVFTCRLPNELVWKWDEYAMETEEWLELIRAEANLEGIMCQQQATGISQSAYIERAVLRLDRARIEMWKLAKGWYDEIATPRLAAGVLSRPENEPKALEEPLPDEKQTPEQAEPVRRKRGRPPKNRTEVTPT